MRQHSTLECVVKNTRATGLVIPQTLEEVHPLLLEANDEVAAFVRADLEYKGRLIRVSGAKAE